MPRSGKPAVGLPALTLMLAGCVDVLGLDEYESAAEVLCVCDQDVPQFEGRCIEVLAERLASASPERREDFLALFAESCADSCDRAAACYQHDVLCSAEGEACKEDRECCGPGDLPLCDPSTQRCRAAP